MAEKINTKAEVTKSKPKAKTKAKAKTAKAKAKADAVSKTERGKWRITGVIGSGISIKQN